MLRGLVLVLVLMFIAMGQAFSANFYLEMKGTPTFFRLIGTIEQGDLEQIKNAFSSAGIEKDPESPWASVATLIVSSPGGSVIEALKIGRWLRAKQFSVILPEDGKCFSACIYLLAAGLDRQPLGVVGIHRPFFAQPPTDDIEISFRSMLEASRVFFKDMNVPARLADDMFSTPPESIRILDDEDLSSYRLNQMDMAYRERNDLATAEYYGMPRVEYLDAKKKSDLAIDKLCRLESTREMLACIDDVNKSVGLVPAERKIR